MKKKIFGVFSLRVTVFASAFGFFSLAWFTFLVNVTDYKENSGEITFFCTWILVGAMLDTVFIALIIVTWGIALYAARNKVSYKALFMSVVTWTTFIILWVMAILVTCVDNTGITLINQRGPESFWLLKNTFNQDTFTVNYEYYELQEEGSQVDSPTDGFFHDESFKRIDTVIMKWLLIFLSVFLFGWFICGAWYAVFSYSQEIEYKMKCVRRRKRVVTPDNSINVNIHCSTTI